MRTRVAEMMDVDLPIFAFSHCRDVVAAVSRGGGFGVFGLSHLWPEQLEVDLTWIDEHVDGKPYGVDVLLPASYAGDDPVELETKIPQRHRDFVAGLKKRFQIPDPKTPHEEHSLYANFRRATHVFSRQMLDISFRHPVKLIASGLGPPPRDIVEEAHAKGIYVAGLVGDPRHVPQQHAAGVDLIVATGTESGGHTNRIATMVVVPLVVDAAAPTPVLAAGGIASGRQVAAALALGAEGVWTGTVWLTSLESDVDPIVVDKLLKARATDAIITRANSGKTVRALRTPWHDAWEEPGAPAPLQTPLQAMLTYDVTRSIYEHRIGELMSSPVGQVVESLREVRSCRDILYDMAVGFLDATERVARIAELAAAPR